MPVLKEPTHVLELLESRVRSQCRSMRKHLSRWNRRSMLGDPPCTSNHTSSTVLFISYWQACKPLELAHMLGDQPRALRSST